MRTIVPLPVPTEIKAVFIRIPKTGSTSLTSVFEKFPGIVSNFRHHFLPQGSEPFLYRAHEQNLGREVMRQAHTFSFVRNPYDRAVSSWKFIEPQVEFKQFLSSLLHTDLVQPATFNQKTWHCCLQLPHLCEPEGGEVRVNFLGRFETLQADTDRLLKQLGYPQAALPWFCRSRRGPYQEYYDSESLEMVEAIYRQDIDAFGYEYQPQTGD